MRETRTKRLRANSAAAQAGTREIRSRRREEAARILRAYWQRAREPRHRRSCHHLRHWICTNQVGGGAHRLCGPIARDHPPARGCSRQVAETGEAARTAGPDPSASVRPKVASKAEDRLRISKRAPVSPPQAAPGAEGTTVPTQAAIVEPPPSATPSTPTPIADAGAAPAVPSYKDGAFSGWGTIASRRYRGDGHHQGRSASHPAVILTVLHAVSLFTGRAPAGPGRRAAERGGGLRLQGDRQRQSRSTTRFVAALKLASR
jgi:hypothetical protein